MSALYLHIESTDSMLPQVFVLMNFYILMRYVLCSKSINGVGHHWEWLILAWREDSGLQREWPEFEHRYRQLFFFLFSFCSLIIHKSHICDKRRRRVNILKPRTDDRKKGFSKLPGWSKVPLIAWLVSNNCESACWSFIDCLVEVSSIVWL